MGISNVNGYSNSSSLTSNSLSELSKPLPTLFDVLAETDATKSSGDISDILDLSPQAQAAADQLNSSTETSLLSRLSDLFGGNTIEDIQASADDGFASVKAKLNKLFKENNIDTSKEIKLQVGADGQVIEVSDNPQKAQIMQLFKDNPDLRDEYVKFTAMSELAAAAREAVAFQAAYAKDPQAAVAQYEYLFNDNTKGTLSLSILGDEYQALFERTGHEAIVVSKSE
jgi:hypothetical protein